MVKVSNILDKFDEILKIEDSELQVEAVKTLDENLRRFFYVYEKSFIDNHEIDISNEVFKEEETLDFFGSLNLDVVYSARSTKALDLVYYALDNGFNVEPFVMIEDYFGKASPRRALLFTKN